MGSHNGQYSRDMFDELKEYAYPLFQRGPNKPLVDADINDGMMAIWTHLRRVQQLFGDGSPSSTMFKIEESIISNVNNFKVGGGDGTGSPEGAGLFWLHGLKCILSPTFIEWDTNSLVDGVLIHSLSTGLTATKLTDTSANWIVNEFAGRTIYPNVTSGTGFTVLSNTINEITISAGDMTTVAAAGDYFRVDPSTPGAGDRTDTVYVDVYIDEEDETEDTNLLHPLTGGTPFASALRGKVHHVIGVRENTSVIAAGPYTDPDGNIHWYFGIARLFRKNGDNTIRHAPPTGPTITDLVWRDLFAIAAIAAEIVAARGNAVSLAARLLVSLDLDGYLQADVVANVNVVATADIRQSKIYKSLVYDDTFVAAAGDLEDDLNRLRNELKVAKGSADWETDATRSLNSVEAEQTTARGTLPNLGARLDVFSHTDGMLKELELGSRLKGLAGEQSIIFLPEDGNWQTKYRLHQFNGFGNWQGYGMSPSYLNFGRWRISIGNYPIAVTFGANPGLGGEDNDLAHSPTPSVDWFPVWVIWKVNADANRTKTAALVYGAPTRNPFNGPVFALTGKANEYDFVGNGYVWYKFIGYVRNGQALSWEIVPMRKVGNHVEYEQEQLVYSVPISTTSGNISVATRVPPTSMRAFFNIHANVHDDAGLGIYISPPHPVSGNLPLQDATPISPLSAAWKIYCEVASDTGDSISNDESVGWCDTDDIQAIFYNCVVSGSTGAYEAGIYVRGYKEFTEERADSHSF